jgi:hypothetical protein
MNIDVVTGREKSCTDPKFGIDEIKHIARRASNLITNTSAEKLQAWDANSMGKRTADQEEMMATQRNLMGSEQSRGPIFDGDPKHFML